jgi:hypothetical protein
VISAEDRRELEAEIADLTSRYGLVPVVDALGALCAERAHRIGSTLRARRDAVGGGLAGLVHGIRDFISRSGSAGT